MSTSVEFPNHQKIMKQAISVFWHRRDLRLEDNAGLYYALKSKYPVLPLFIFDTNILEDLEDKQDARVTFIYKQLKSLHKQLKAQGSSLLVLHGKPEVIWQKLLNDFNIKAVFTNRDYEPYSRNRDEQINTLLSEKNIPFHSYKDHVIFERDEVVKENGGPYLVFTPYSKKWLAKLDSRKVTGDSTSYYLQSYPNRRYFKNFLQLTPYLLPELSVIGFELSEMTFPGNSIYWPQFENYKATRDFPAHNGTSQLSVHFRFGTISIRKMARNAQKHSTSFLNELIWREFYSMILYHFPQLVKSPFRQKYKFIEWRNDEKEFEAWCEGKTGYPLVDAGMRQLNSTGWMHNRVRMVVASFLTKHLLIDWRWGEAYFASKLIDYELSSNNGGWQWAAGCGTDAAPYFRIFNPEAQLKKFDPEEEYVRKWIPELWNSNYPAPIVDHKKARERCLIAFKRALQEADGRENE